jgi:hypothetical protein
MHCLEPALVVVRVAHGATGAHLRALHTVFHHNDAVFPLPGDECVRLSHLCLRLVNVLGKSDANSSGKDGGKNDASGKQVHEALEIRHLNFSINQSVIDLYYQRREKSQVIFSRVL